MAQVNKADGAEVYDRLIKRVALTPNMRRAVDRRMSEERAAAQPQPQPQPQHPRPAP